MGKRRNKRELKKADQEKRERSAKIKHSRSTPAAKRYGLAWLLGEAFGGVKERYERDPKGFILRSAYAVLMAVFFIFAILPDFVQLRQNAVFDIIERICFSSLPLYFAYFSKNRPKYIVAKILMIFVAAFFWIGLLGISGKIRLIMTLVFCWISVLYIVGLKVIKDEHFPVLTWTLLTLTFIVMLSGLSSYTFLDSPGALKFWGGSLIFGLICGVICAILLFNGAIALKDDRTSEKVALVFLAVAVGFFMFMSSAYHLNYALDPDPPREETVIITNKDVRSSGKSTKHEFYFWYDGEERKIDVSSDTYDLTEVGDRFEILVCNGAFDKPFLREK